MRDVCADFQAELVEFNGENNHVHLRVNYPPKMAVARLVNSLNGVSSHRLRQEFPDLLRHNYQANKPWPGSYCGLHGRDTAERRDSTSSNKTVPLRRRWRRGSPPNADLHPHPERRSITSIPAAGVGELRRGWP
ncbi:hypothetical protein GCM10023317_43340 [Actinopolymorpha pittospori]